MDTWDCIKKRRCTHEFKSKQVERRDIYKILDAGTYAPSAGNTQNWRFVLVEDKDKIEAIGRATLQPDSFFNVKSVVVVCSETGRVISDFPQRGAVYAVQNVAAAIENMLIMATDLGIDACWIGAFSEDSIKKVLHIPQEIDVHAVVPLGYARRRAKKQARIPLAHLLFFDDWNEKNAQKPFLPLSRHVDKIKKVLKKK